MPSKRIEVIEATPVNFVLDDLHDIELASRSSTRLVKQTSWPE
jgi:hypothetical protein